MAPMAESSLAKRVWRVRWWVRALSVAVLAFPVATFLAPSWFNPTWEEGMPADQLPWLIGVLVVLLMVMCATFYARVELTGEQVRVVNPWRTHAFPLREIADMRPGSFGLEFELTSGRKVSAFAVQCTYASIGPEPRWVEVAQTLATARLDRVSSRQAVHISVVAH